jgi:hypothetical protein
MTLYIYRTAPLTSGRCILYIWQQIYVLNILNMLYILRFFFSSKCHLFHNATFFGSCIIHILHTGCAKIKKTGTKGLMRRDVMADITDMDLRQSGEKSLVPRKEKCLRFRTTWKNSRKAVQLIVICSF